MGSRTTALANATVGEPANRLACRYVKVNVESVKLPVTALNLKLDQSRDACDLTVFITTRRRTRSSMKKRRNAMMIVHNTLFLFCLAQLSVFVLLYILERFRFILLEWSMVAAHPSNKSEGIM
jgi:hypothetical protein